jgi:glutamine amidotransferase
MIAIFDLGVGNLSSVQSGFARAGADTTVIANADDWERTVREHHLVGCVLPGVGAFADAMFQLRARGLLSIVRQLVRDQLPLLGICLGMQLLLSVSEEHGRHVGFGFIPGEVVRFGKGVKVPHMGWNDLTRVASHPLVEGVREGDYVYFVHSYYVHLQDERDAVAVTQYGDVTVPAVIARGSVFGTQFHPEKSGAVGERILGNFVRVCELSRGGVQSGR